MRRLLTLIIVVLTLIVGISFSQLNASFVTFNYYLGSVEAPLSLVVIASLTVGALLGILVALAVLLKFRSENHRLKRKIDIREKELKNLREIPIKDSH